MNSNLRSLRVLSLTASIAGIGALAPTRASAIVHYQTGFEAPTFTLGPLIGQDGWVGDPAANPAITVQNTVVASGSQAVRANAAGDPLGFQWAWKPLSTVTVPATTAEPLVTISWDMQLSPLGGGDTPTKLWGIDLYNGTGRIAVVGIFQDTGGPVIAGTGADGQTLFNLGGAPARGAWHNFQIVLNYDELTYDVRMDGNLIDFDVPFNVGANAGVDRTLGDADFTGQERGTDIGYFDNYSVTSAPVPEPTTIALSALGGCALLQRRR
jgi:hypothetical protein